ncbi:MAG: nicotinate phosphoribosyltransferase [Armatimonadota bacterium]
MGDDLKRESNILLTDLYELTMMAAYYDSGMEDQQAVFEYIFRRLPRNTGFAIMAGLDPLLDDLEELHFSPDDLEYLRSLGIFAEEFIEAIKDFRFKCDVYAAPEGSLIFPNETICRVHGPLAQSQIIETLVLNRLNYQTLIATKAARCTAAAQGDPIVEFGLRRAQGPDGGISGSRAAYIGGARSTSNVIAGKLFGIPVMGTHAHSWVMAFDTELESFRAYVRAFPQNPVLLLDTYDTLESGVPNAIIALNELRAGGKPVRAGVRLDSGDIAKLSKEVHKRLEAAGFPDPLIVASNELDEYLIADMKRQGAKVNSWGVGTRLVTGGDEPALGGVYKLSAVFKESGWDIKMKISNNAEKTTDPGVKMPYRFYSPEGEMLGDVMFLENEDAGPVGAIISHDRMVFERTRAFREAYERRPLLQQVMKNGKRLIKRKSVSEIQSYAKSQLKSLPAEMQRLINPEIYWVGLSETLAEKKRAAIKDFWAGKEAAPTEPGTATAGGQDIGGEI